MISRIGDALKKVGPYYRQIIASKPPRLIYCGGYVGHDNLGDEALLSAYQTLFNKYAIIHYPAAGGRVLAVPSRVLGLADAAVLAGGTVIGGKGYLPSMRECCDNFKHRFVFGSGVRDPVYWGNVPDYKHMLQEWQKVLDRCFYVGVRGPRSAEILADVGVEAEVIGDPVIRFCDDTLLEEREIIPQSIGLNIGQSKGRMWGDESAVQKEFARLAGLARKAGWRTRWFVVWPEDKDATLQAARESGTESEICEVYRSPHEFLDLVRPLQVFVGIKLHAVVLATCAYVPSVMLEYRPKCRDYMRSIGQEAYTVRTDSFKAEAVWEMVQSLSAERSRVSGCLGRQLRSLKSRQLQKAEEIMAVIGCSREPQEAPAEANR